MCVMLQGLGLCFIFLSLIATGPWALAEASTPISLSCNMSFKIEGNSVDLGLAETSASGQGRLSCYEYLTGTFEEIPLKVSVKGLGHGAGLSGFHISGGKVGLGINTEPESLLGSYARIGANPALGAGAQTGGGFRLDFKKGSIKISAILAGSSGLGAGFEVSELLIERDPSRPARMTHTSATRSAEAMPPQSAELPTENLVLNAQGSEVILLNAKGVPVKKLKIYLRLK